MIGDEDGRPAAIDVLEAVELRLKKARSGPTASQNVSPDMSCSFVFIQTPIRQLNKGCVWVIIERSGPSERPEERS